MLLTTFFGNHKFKTSWSGSSGYSVGAFFNSCSAGGQSLIHVLPELCAFFDYVMPDFSNRIRHKLICLELEVRVRAGFRAGVRVREEAEGEKITI